METWCVHFLCKAFIWVISYSGKNNPKTSACCHNSSYWVFFFCSLKMVWKSAGWIEIENHSFIHLGWFCFLFSFVSWSGGECVWGGGSCPCTVACIFEQSTFLADGQGFKRKSPLALRERKRWLIQLHSWPVDKVLVHCGTPSRTLE